MSLCARAVALWLAACALAARAQYESLRPECPSHANQSCQFVESLPSGFKFLVNGKHVEINVADDTYAVECTDVAINDPAWPFYPHPIHFGTVDLKHCPLDPSALKALNVGFTRLIQTLIPALKGSISFADLPRNLEHLQLGMEVGPVVLESGVLDRFEKLSELVLANVQLNPLPMHLNELVLWDTGIKVLPSGANYVKKLVISEKDLKTVNLTNPQLHTLTLRGYYGSAVESLMIRDASPEVLMDGLLVWCKHLEWLEIRRVRASKLPADLLRGVAILTHFTFTHGNITTLPLTLFTHSPLLQLIDVSKNMLDTLPNDVFSGLPELRVLWLENNRLSARDLRAILPLATLTSLDLSDNPLGDLCSSGNTALSSLRQLQVLSLAHTNATSICHMWLRQMNSLRHLDLRGNLIRNVVCGAFFEAYASGSNSTGIDLRENPLEPSSCSDDNLFADTDLGPKPVQQLTDSLEQCICNCPFVQCVVQNTTLTTTDVNMPTTVSTTPVTSILSVIPLSATTLSTTARVAAGTSGLATTPTTKPKILTAESLIILTTTTPGPTPGPTDLYLSLKEGENATEALANVAPSITVLSLFANKHLMLEPGALSQPSLDGIRYLNLEGVYANHLPKNLDVLHLENTGIEKLLPEALNVEILEIREPNLTTITGSVPRLRSLVLYSAPALVSLILDDTLPELLQDGLVDQTENQQSSTEKWVVAVEFRRSRATLLPYGLLRGAWDLTTFKCIHGILTTVSPDLFKNNGKLQVVDLSDNKLRTIPSELFKSLTQLRELRLEDNLLVEHELRGVPLAERLVTVALSGNPLGDLCPGGNTSFLSSLHNLQELFLARTGALRVCPDWLFEMRALQHLDLRNNQVRSISCSMLRDYRGMLLWEHRVTVIDLKENPLELFDCADNHTGAVDDLSLKTVEILMDSFATCNCNCPFVWQCVAETPGTTNGSLEPLISHQISDIELEAISEYLFKKKMTLSQIKDELEITLKTSAPLYTTVKNSVLSYKHRRESINELGNCKQSNHTSEIDNLPADRRAVVRRISDVIAKTLREAYDIKNQYGMASCENRNRVG